ncbi:MAG: type IV secretion system protein [Steroidobacteraceae bacterium]
MGFFATFWNWLNGALSSYIGATTVRVADLLEPALIALGTVYVTGWGYLLLSGRIREPLGDGLRRIAILAVVLGVGVHLWLYNTLIVNTFYRAPAEFAADLVGAAYPVQTLDAIWNAGGAVAGRLFDQGSIWRGDMGFYLAGAVVWVLVGLLCVYTMFLLALSSIALSVLLAIGPLFIATLLFEGTRRLFAAWLAQLTNYALISILTVMVAALLLHLVQRYATQTAALGSAIDTVDALDFLLATVLVFLFMRQVMPIAAGLSGGIALSTFGLMSRTMRTAASPFVAGASYLAPAAAGAVVAMSSAARARLRRREGAQIGEGD